MREFRGNIKDEEVVVDGGSDPHGRWTAPQACYVRENQGWGAPLSTLSLFFLYVNMFKETFLQLETLAVKVYTITLAYFNLFLQDCRPCRH